MGNRETNALWLLPVAYVVTDRVLGFVIWQSIMLSGETSVVTPAFSLVLSIACALAAACLCVYGHYRIVGPLPLQRSVVMAAISIPVFLLAGLATMGLRSFVRYWSEVPMQAAIHYAVAFFALPAAASIMAPKQGMAPQSVAAVEAPATPPPSSTGVILLRVVVGLLSLGLFLGGGLFVIIILGFSGSHMSGEDQAFLLAAIVAVVTFGFCFLCAVGRFRRTLRIARAAVAAISVPFAAWALVEGGEEGVWAVIALGLYVGAFWAMCRGMEARA